MSVLTLQTTRLPQPYVSLTDTVIPAVPGEFYAYPTEISDEKSLQIFCKCKTNKGRMASELITLGEEANLYWDISGRRVFSVQEALRQNEITSDVSSETLCDTWLTHTNLGPDQFYAIASQRNAQALKQECLLTFAGQSTKAEVLNVSEQRVIAVMTSNGKYGLMLIAEMSESIQIDACHVLLD